MIERNDNMVDMLDRPVYVGDTIYIPSSYGSGASLYIIKHFSNNGIFGWRLSPWTYRKAKIKDRVDTTLNHGKLGCSSRYYQYTWGSSRGLSSAIIKVDVEDLPISRGKYKAILRLMGVEKDEFKPTGSIRL